MNRLWMVLAMTATVLRPSSVASQNGPPVATRIRVQVASPSVASPDEAWVVGHLARVGADTLWLRLASPDGPLVAIDRATIQLLETSNGRSRHPGQGALWGAGAGLGLGLLALAALDDCAIRTRGWSFDLCGDNEGFVILGSVAAGAAWGAVIGLLITSERWAATTGATLVPTVTGRGVGVTLRVALGR